MRFWQAGGGKPKGSIKKPFWSPFFPRFVGILNRMEMTPLLKMLKAGRIVAWLVIFWTAWMLAACAGSPGAALSRATVVAQAATSYPAGSPSPNPTATDVGYAANTPVVNATATATPNANATATRNPAGGYPTDNGTPSPSVPTATGNPTSTPTVAATGTAAVTPTPTVPSATPTSANTATPPPVRLGTPITGELAPLQEGNLKSLGLAASWGRGSVTALAWSADGKWTAIGTAGGVYMDTGSPLAENMNGLIISDTQPGSVKKVAFPPVDAPAADADGLLLLTRQMDTAGHTQDRLAVWQLGHNVPMTTMGGSISLVTDEEILDASYAQRQGKRVIAALVTHANGVDAVILDQTTGKLNPVATLNTSARVRLGAISPDFNWAAVVDEGGVRLWNTTTGSLSAPLDTGTPGGITRLAFSPDGKLLAVGITDSQLDYQNTNAVQLWRVGEPAARAQTFTDPFAANGLAYADGRDQALLSLAWSADGAQLAAGMADSGVRLWQVGSKDKPKRLWADGLPMALTFSADGTQLMTANAQIFNLLHDDSTPGLADFLPTAQRMVLSPDGKMLALLAGHRLELRSTEDGRLIYALTDLPAPVRDLAFSPNVSLLLLGCDDGTARLYRVSDGRYLTNVGLPTVNSPVYSVAYSPNGKWMAVGRADMTIQVFRVLDGVLMLGLREPFVAYRLQFSPNVDQLASLTTSGVRLRLFGGELQRISTSLQADIGGVGLMDMAYSPGSESIVVVGNGVVRAIAPDTQKVRYTLSGGQGVMPLTAAYTPDHAFLLVSWSDHTLRVYWAADGTLMRRVEHGENFTSLQVSPDGARIYTLNANGVQVWGARP